MLAPKIANAPPFGACICQIRTMGVVAKYGRCRALRARRARSLRVREADTSESLATGPNRPKQSDAGPYGATNITSARAPAGNLKYPPKS